MHCRQHSARIQKQTSTHSHEPRYNSVKNTGIKLPLTCFEGHAPFLRVSCLVCSKEQGTVLETPQQWCLVSGPSGILLSPGFCTTLAYLGSCKYVHVRLYIPTKCRRQCTRPARPSVSFCVIRDFPDLQRAALAEHSCLGRELMVTIHHSPFPFSRIP